jgi:hypothetical protein
MHPILFSALTDVAVDLYRRFMASPTSSEAAAPQEESEGPQTWQEAHAQVVAFAEEKNKIDEEQSALLVQIAEKIDAVAEEQKKLLERFESHIVSARRVQIVSLLGGLCGVAALAFVILK